MNTQIEQVSEKMAAAIIASAQNILSDSRVAVNPKTGKNNLRNSLLSRDIESIVRITESGGIVINTFFGNYLRYIEQGRPPKQGKMPPVDALRDWALKNGLSADNDTLWAISYAIWRDGYAGRPILATLEKEIEKSWQQQWADELFFCFISELNNYFKS